MNESYSIKAGIWDEAPSSLTIEMRQPKRIPEAEDSIEFHASRLLLIIYYAGGRNKQIEGRTKLAKLDFFVRYPTYLIRAARLKNYATKIRYGLRPESRMIRYKYGPWDEKYFNIFAYLVAKDFVEILPHWSNKSDVFRLTEKGKSAVEELDGSEFVELIERCQLVGNLFGTTSGNTIKNFIYANFLDVVTQPLGSPIEGEDAR